MIISELFKVDIKIISRYFAIIPLILIVGCVLPNTVVKVPYVVDGYDCPKPSEAISINKQEMEIAIAKTKDFAIGNLHYKNEPRLIKIMSKSASDDMVREYLLCLAKNRDGYTNAQQSHLRNKLLFMKSNPEPKEIMEWDKQNPFPPTPVINYFSCINWPGKGWRWIKRSCENHPYLCAGIGTTVAGAIVWGICEEHCKLGCEWGSEWYPRCKTDETADVKGSW